MINSGTGTIPHLYDSYKLMTLVMKMTIKWWKWPNWWWNDDNCDTSDRTDEITITLVIEIMI